MIFCGVALLSKAQTPALDAGVKLPSADPIVVYDQTSGNYLYYYSFDKRKTAPYKVVSGEEYRREQFLNLLRKGWATQRGAQSGSGGLGQANGGTLPTTFNIRSDAFKAVFGSNEITINPQGSLDLTFQINNTYTDNPVIPERYRSTTNFDFSTKMQFNIDGSIGDRLKLNFNYNTEATFDFETNLKLEYAGNEDDILQKIEAGNVSLPLDGTLITGGQSLFGIKADLKFGNLTVTGILSRQDAESKSIEIQGGGQSNMFDIAADKYDANRHFFLAHYFRDNYDRHLANLPLILSGLNIKRVEVWVTNKVARSENARSIVSFMDLAESERIHSSRFQSQHGGFPDSLSNNLLTVVRDLRKEANSTSYLNGLGLTSGVDFEKLDNARMLTENEYKVNMQLGYISLNQSLNNDEVLAVAYEYEAGGRSYRVGDFSTDGIMDSTSSKTGILITKLLKGTAFSPKLPTWKLMMKNVYSLDNYNISSKDFQMEIMYENSEVGTMVPYLSEGSDEVKQKPLLRVLRLDNLNSQRDAFPDGQFDFVEGITILSDRGKIIFPVLEPFGSYLKKKINNNEVAKKYVFQELYDSSLVKAQSMADKNRFRLVGNYLSEGGSEIRLNATNIPQGSVVVTAGGIKLQENVDYEVNYILGTVRILNQAYLESGTPIKIALENRELFNMQTKTLMGTHLKYKFNDNFYVGATLLHLSERPLTQKVNWGDEPISNTIWGINTAFTTEVPLLTRLIDALPILQTKEKSTLSFDAEFAQFLPGHSSAIGASGGTVFIDDFENSETALDLRNINSWTIASTPQGQERGLFPEGNRSNDLSYGFNRAQFSWFTIYPELLRSSAYEPAGITMSDYQRNHLVREIPINEVFPDQEHIVGEPTNIPMFNVAYYPNERGPYNYTTDLTAVNGKLKLTAPEKRWGGIMRALPVTDFETANYDYIEFWVMDPFVYKQTDENGKPLGGKLYFNLGNLSEDVLKDGRKSFENGLPTGENIDNPTRYDTTAWGRVPNEQMLTQTFDNNLDMRRQQDVGYDGLSDAYERNHFARSFLDKLTQPIRALVEDDPSADNYKYYLDPSYAGATIFDRYKYYNNAEGNSQSSDNSNNTMASTFPDMEDINRDYTMNESENYYQYEIDLSPGMYATNYVADSRTVIVNNSPVTWYQFKIPISEGKAIGTIDDFKSIRFVRMFMRGFSDTTVLRFATLQLVRGDWRRYTQSLLEGQEGLAQPEMDNAKFEISSVNIEENASRIPVNYVLPPGTSRQIDPGQYQVRQLNEQSMLLKVIDLADGDARGAYKNTNFDFRQYRRLKMDVHAEAINGYDLKDGEMSVFIRIGTDYRYNYYEYEIPLSLTPSGIYKDNEREKVWPSENRLDVEMEVFTNAKLARNAEMKTLGGTIASLFEKPHGKNMVRVVGNPNLGNIRAMMIGVRNPKDNGLSRSAIVWANELRLTNLDETSGFAANARVTAKLADFGNVTVAGNMMTPNFGSLESKMNERSQVQVYQYDIAANLELGMMFPRDFGVRLPFFFGFMENYTTPKYNPFDQDILMKDAVRSLTSYERDSLYRMAMDYKQRLAVNFTNIRVAANAMEQKVFHPSNLSLGLAYSRLFAHNAKIDHQEDISYHAGLAYAYNVQPFYIDMFKNVGWLKAKPLRLIGDLNINPYPNQFSFTTDINRTYNEVQYRSISAPDIVVLPTAAKDFTWDRDYRMQWDLMRSVKLEFNANNRARIDEPEGIIDKTRDPEGYRHWHDSTWTNFWRFGRNTQYYHRYDLTWTVPIHKIPLLEWTSATLRYGGAYDWQAAPLLRDETYNPGNTISNDRNIIASMNFSFESLYNKVPFLRKINDEFSGRSRKLPVMIDVAYESNKLNFTAKTRRVIRHKLNTEKVKAIILDADGKEIKGTVDVLDKNSVAVTLDQAARGAHVKVTGRVPKKPDLANYAGRATVRFAMLLRSISVTYNQTDATILPGFMPNSQLLGMNYNNGWAPGWGFVFGNQDEGFVEKARRMHWLSQDTTLVSPYSMNTTNSWTIRANLEPFRDFRIEVGARRSYSENKLSYNVSSPSAQRQISGNFNMSVWSISSAFESPKPENNYYSKAFQTFLDNRHVVAQRLAKNRATSGLGYTAGVDANGFPDGYSALSAEVLIPSFLAAYTGRSAGNITLNNFLNIPFPNWSITYNGLHRIKALKDIITSATLMHKYEATYAINSYSLNQNYEEDMDGFSYVRNALGDFVAQRDILTVSIDEHFSPLFYLSLDWFNALSTRVEWIKSRRIGLSMANNQITENRTNSWSVGLGYTFREFPVLFTFMSRRTSTAKTMLRLRADLMVREDLNILRNIVKDESGLPQLSDGKETVTIKCSADYNVSSNIMIRLFFDRVVNRPRVSAVGTANTNAGISINILLAQ